jgi:hypothetical protein
MFRFCLACCLLLSAVSKTAWAESQAERGGYLVNTIMACMLKPPMAFAYYSGLKETDLGDIIAYLRTVPPLQ